MGSYTFRWDDPAEEVIITGLFDDWAKSIKMDKKDGYFEKTVHIPQEHIDKKVYYKFVVDGNWTDKESARGEYLGSNYDNFLLPEEIDKDPSAAAISSVTPSSTTAQMAGEVPKEPKLPEEKELPGAFPETPGATPAAENQTFGVAPIPASETAGNPIKLAPEEPVPDASTFTKNTVSSTVEDDSSLKKNEPESPFSVNPLPATSGAGNPITLAPGEKVPDPSTLTSNTISSTVQDDPSLKKDEPQSTFSVNPIPATSGLGNPITLAPGEKVPDSSTFTSNTIQSTVSDDNKADALAQDTKASNGTLSTNGGLFGVPPIMSTTIPESSLPMGGDATKDTEVDAGPTIQSAAPLSSTAVLAGQVPKEAKPEPTVQSAAPESSTAALAGQVPKESPADPTVQSAAPTSTTATLAGQVPKVSDEVPEIVSESQKEAKVDPEASASAQTVAEKTAVEAELLKEVKKETAAAESGRPAESTKVVEPTPAVAAPAVVPDPVKKSIAQADASPEAATNQAAVADKTAVEEELKKTVPEEQSKGEPGPTAAASTSATAPAATTETAAVASKTIPEPPKAVPADSRDVSPMSKTPTAGHPNPGQQTEPTVTTGPVTTTAPKKSEAAAAPSTPKKTEASASTPKKTTATTPKKSEDAERADGSAKKKRNRLSAFVHKLKDKF